MALNLKISNAAANAAIDAIAALLNGGKLRIYSGTQPADADSAVGAGTLLAELDFGSPAFGSAAAGVATANAITEETSAPATNTAAWFRCITSGAATVLDGSVGTSDADLILPTVSIVAGAEVHVDSFTLTLPKSA